MGAPRRVKLARTAGGSLPVLLSQRKGCRWRLRGSRRVHDSRQEFDHAACLFVPVETRQYASANGFSQTLEFSPIHERNLAQLLAQRVFKVICIQIDARLPEHLIHSTGARGQNSLAGHSKLKTLRGKAVLKSPE